MNAVFSTAPLTSDGNGAVTLSYDTSSRAGCAAPTPPTATPHFATTARATSVLVRALDGDAGDAIRIQSVGQTSDGTVSMNPDGTITFVPDAAFLGTTVFTYTIVDSAGQTATSTVTITVTSNVNPAVLAASGFEVASPLAIATSSVVAGATLVALRLRRKGTEGTSRPR
ncbi:Ig-like domain-containing protein [Rathayibacter sp. YIM 133350]|uniref:Ig-like domain-containing protein n=1 Tax=Rathayibacter sp. YIM 133350 TaxID=3131992 RepID=UPI00307E0ED2